MYWSALLPPLITLALVLSTRRIILSLALAVVFGSFLKTGLSLNGLITASGYLAGAIAQKENAYTVAFLVLFGALAELAKVTGGIAGFTTLVGRRIRSERGVLLTTWALLPFTFFDNSFRSLSVGAMLAPLMENIKGSKEKLAFVLTVTTGQVIVLIPLATAYVGYMVSLIRANLPPEAAAPYNLFLRSLPWNFYSLAMLILALGVSLWGLRYGQLQVATIKGEEELTRVHEEREKYLEDLPPEYQARVTNLIVPIAFLLAATVFFLWWTGREKAGSFLASLAAADFTVALMTGAFVTLIFSALFFWSQGISLAEIEAHLIEGGQSVLNLLAILVLSWALSQTVRDLGFQQLVTTTLATTLPGWAMPTVIFLAGAGISYVIGSSWATWALLMPLAASLAGAGNLDPAIAYGAVWAGGSVGDSTSPLSDIPILVSTVLKIPVAGYASSALPFALGGIILAALAYMVTGFW